MKFIGLSKMIRFIKWFFSATEKPITEKHIDFYSKLVEVDDRYKNLLFDLKRLEEENLEIKDILHELTRSMNAIEDRIDILAGEWRSDV